MPSAYAYIRYSTAIQKVGDSENRQFSALELFEKVTGVRVVEEIYDRGKSAYRGDNIKSGRFGEIISRIESGEVKAGDYLVVESIDRITRQRLVEGVSILQDILKKGINIYTTIDGKIYSYKDPTKDLETLIMISVIANRANEESEIKSKRLEASWRTRREKAENGEVIIKKGKSIPYGLRVKDGKFVIHEEEQAEIQKMFELLLDYGINTSIKKINATAKKPWNSGTLNKIINSRSVIGCMATHKMDFSSGKGRKIHTGYIENYYPNLIDPVLFFKVRDRMKERKIKSYNGRRSEQDFNIFKHLIFCEECGSKLYYDHRGSRYKGKIYPHFRCDGKRTGVTDCDCDNIRFEVVLALFLDALAKLKKVTSIFKSIGIDKGEAGKTNEVSDKISDLLSKPKEELANKELEKKISQMASYRKTYENLTKTIDNYDGTIPNVVLNKMGTLEDNIASLSKEIEALQGQATETRLDIQDGQTLLDLFLNEEGRAKINAFLLENNIIIKALFIKSVNTGIIKIARLVNGNLEEIVHLNGDYPKKGILKKYGYYDLQEMFNLKDKDE